MVEMKNIDKDTLKEMALAVSDLILLVFVIYFVTRGYPNSIPIVDLALILISAIFCGVFLRMSDPSEVGSEGDLKKAKSYFRVAVGFSVLGYLFLVLALFVSKKGSRSYSTRN